MSESRPHTHADVTRTIVDSSLRQRVKRIMLVVTAGPDEGSRLQTSRGRVTIGRSGVNDLVLTDTLVSGIHVELLVSERGVLARDLESTNGTAVGEVLIREAWLSPGMSLSLGETTIELRSTDEVPVALSNRPQFGAMWGDSPSMRQLFAVLERIAPTDMSVLIGGETGSGKELVARALHDESPRAERPFVVLDCGSLPRELAEAAILGHKKGSFTGALSDRAGCFEDADTGTLFLDEIGELPLELQPKLLRVLDRREVQRIGETRVRPVDVRVVAATHRDLRAMVSRGEFREDLYFRLSVMTVDLPPLRKRGEDIGLLADKFLSDFARAQQKPVLRLSPAARASLLAQPWPGNVRELKNTIIRAAYLARGQLIEPPDLHVGRRPAPPTAPAGEVADGVPLVSPEILAMPFKQAKQAVLDQFERRYLQHLLAQTGDNLSRAAAEAGLTRYYLRELLKRLGLRKGKEESS